MHLAFSYFVIKSPDPRTQGQCPLAAGADGHGQNAPIRSGAGAPQAPPAEDRGARRTCGRLNESGEQEWARPACHRDKLCHSYVDDNLATKST